jgi:hypothetical protein
VGEYVDVTFLAVGALAIALLVLVPTIAHLLQRGRRNSIDFPLVRLVLPTPKLSNRRRRLQDRLLLVLRGTLIVTLALLGAVPLIRCDRPVLSRQQGASVALAIVLDDSGSMRAKLPNGTERFFHARQLASQVISQLREGDLVALVLAGSPARLQTGATSQLRVVRDLCLRTPASDRSTDLSGAIELAENSLRNLPQSDRRIVVFSDLGQPIPKTTVPQWYPNPELASPIHDCGIVTAIQQGTQVVVDVACSDESSGLTRKLSLVKRRGSVSKAAEYTDISQPLARGKKLQTIAFDAVPSDVPLEAHLDGADANPHNDRAPVFAGAAGTVVATLADYTTARAASGGAPLIEQALAAFGGDLVVRPWTSLPEDERAYGEISMLVLDDPPAFGPEERAALQQWVARGGIVLAWLGPRAVAESLGTSLSPLLEGRVRWERTEAVGFDPSSLRWLGPTGASFSDLHAQARLLLDDALPPASTVRARWSDFRAALVERPLSRGIVFTFGLPASTEISDIGLRPGFLAVFEHVLETTRQRGLSPIVAAGHPWKFDRDEKVQVEDPDGISVTLNAPQELTPLEKSYVPTLAGLYKIHRGERVEFRLAHAEAQEITDGPNQANASAQGEASKQQTRLDLSPYLTLALVVIVLLELLVSSFPLGGKAPSKPLR